MKIVGRVKIKKLYRYDINHKLYSFLLTEMTCLEKLEEMPWGTLWRAAISSVNGRKDFYGYALRKAAKAEEIINLQRDIARLAKMLRKLKKQ